MIFGPVAFLFRFKRAADAVTLANDAEYALAAYFYSTDHARGRHLSRRLEYGMAGVNTGMSSTEVAPIGGIKASGLGREGSHHGREEYMEIKYVAKGGIA